MFCGRRVLEVKGHVAEEWQGVKNVFQEAILSGVERGGAFAVYHKGALVVDLCGGYSDEEAGVEWNADTLSGAASCTKGITSIVIALLVHREVLNYSEKVSTYWPEFGQHGKGDITLEQLLSHQAGLSSIDEKFSATLMVEDVEELDKILAAQKPHWQPGTRHGYHGHTFGMYLDAVVRRTDKQHRNIADFFRQEIAEPNGLDVHIGLPFSENYRCSRQMDFMSLRNICSGLCSKYWRSLLAFAFSPSSLLVKSMVNPIEFDTKLMVENDPRIRHLPDSSTGCYGTASSLARLYSLLLEGALMPRQMLADDLTEPLCSGRDCVVLFDITYGRGFTLIKSPKGNYTVGTTGFGGQMVYCDPINNLSWAYLTNYQSVHGFGTDPRYLNLLQSVYNTLDTINQ